jgi:hypothetical protein
MTAVAEDQEKVGADKRDCEILAIEPLVTTQPQRALIQGHT